MKSFKSFHFKPTKKNYDSEVVKQFEFGAVEPFHTFEDGMHLSLWIDKDRSKWAIVYHDDNGDYASDAQPDSKMIQQAIKSYR